MAQQQTKKEALFNEVKGSLFEYLVAKELALKACDEISFHAAIDQNYISVLSQQDRMVRQFYPQMLPFLTAVSRLTAQQLSSYLNEVPASIQLIGKLTNAHLRQTYHEADLLLGTKGGTVPVSLKLSKKNAFVNTKSAGVKSFFKSYFPFLIDTLQNEFCKLIGLEFERMSLELHEFHNLDYTGDFSNWVQSGRSELPGELDVASREILKRYYSRISRQMHQILTLALQADPAAFKKSLAPLMGFGNEQILQVICFHDFKTQEKPFIEIHSFSDIAHSVPSICAFHDTASVDIISGSWNLQIRVKPMNKFTTMALKVNCSVKVKPPSDA